MTNVERSDAGRWNGVRRFIRWGVIAGLLALPAVAMQFTGEVNWTAFDFLFAGAVLIGAGLVYELVAWKTANPMHRTLMGLVVIGGVLAVWAWAVAGP